MINIIIIKNGLKHCIAVDSVKDIVVQAWNIAVTPNAPKNPHKNNNGLFLLKIGESFFINTIIGINHGGISK